MYNYVNIGSISTLLMCLYIVYGKCRGERSKFNLITLFLCGLLISYKIIFITNDNHLNVENLNSIYEILIILLILRLNSKNIKGYNFKKVNIVNYIVCSLYTIFLIYNVESIYSKIIALFLLMSVIYLFSISIYESNIKNKYRILILIYLGHISLNILVSDIKIINLGYILDVVASICIFGDLFKLYIIGINKKNIEIKNIIANISNEIKEKEEKISANKNITKTINDNLSKKQILLETIIGEYSKCIIVVDSSGYIINEDDSFVKMWSEYKDYEYNLNLSVFLKNSIINKEKFIKCINQVNERGTKVEGEIEGKDGRYFNCIYSPFTITYENIGVICYIEDITYKKNSEKQIEENNAKYKTIVENIPYSIVLAGESQIVYENNKYSEINLSKNDVEKIVFNKTMNGDINYKNYEDESVCLNIDRANFKDGQSGNNLVAIRNITSYKQILENVNYSKQKYEDLVNVIPEGIYILDYKENLTQYANPALFKITNSQKIEDINIDLINEGIVVTPSNDENMKFKRRIIRNKFGKYIYIECGGILINVNKKIKLIGIIRDITEQVETELIEIEIEKNKIENKNKSEFFVNISHELKTPLNVISSSNQLLEILYKDEILKTPNSELSKAILDIKKYSYMVMGLVNNMMDLAKLESDFHQYKMDYYNIVNIVEDVTEKFSKYILDDSIEIVFDTDEEEKIANVDPHDIEKVILTILSMVVRYSKKDSRINIDIKKKDDKDVIEIENKDFYDHSRYINDIERRNIDIGIEVAKQIMELYNGRIDVKVGSNNNLYISIQLDLDKNRKNYKEIEISKVDDSAYFEYIRICNL